ncbi:hypothetical protein J3F84DRAFT_182056 [Trichoderma pleuroticola]
MVSSILVFSSRRFDSISNFCAAKFYHTITNSSLPGCFFGVFIQKISPLSRAFPIVRSILVFSSRRFVLIVIPTITNFDQISRIVGVFISFVYLDHDVFFLCPLYFWALTSKSMVFASSIRCQPCAAFCPARQTLGVLATHSATCVGFAHLLTPIFDRDIPFLGVYALGTLMPAASHFLSGPPNSWCFGHPRCHFAQLLTPAFNHRAPISWCFHAFIKIKVASIFLCKLLSEASQWMA